MNHRKPNADEIAAGKMVTGITITYHRDDESAWGDAVWCVTQTIHELHEDCDGDWVGVDKHTNLGWFDSEGEADDQVKHTANHPYTLAISENITTNHFTGLVRLR